MFEYGALLSGSNTEHFKNAWQNFINILEATPIYWYAVAFALLFLFARFLMKK